jgi:hypothetical protein
MKNLPSGKRSKAIKTVNPTTGQDTGKETSFSEDNWGIATRTYLRSVNNLRDDSFPKVVTQAQALAKDGRRAGDFTMSGPSVDLDTLDERALLIDNADD